MIRKQKATYSSVPYDYHAHGKRITNANTRPGTPSGTALQDTTGPYQLTIIGGFSDGFHFYPVIVDGCRATIYPHHNMLEYGKSYYVTIDKEVFDLSLGEFAGIYDDKTWRFTTRRHAPEAGRRLSLGESRRQRRLLHRTGGHGLHSRIQRRAMDCAYRQRRL